MPQLFCKEFAETGTCSKENCKGPHVNSEAVAKFKETYGENLERYYHPQGKGNDKGKGKGKGKGDRSKSAKGKGKGKKGGKKGKK